MRREFVRVTKRAYAKRICPWAARIVRCEGGYMCFESHDDYRVWKGQR